MLGVSYKRDVILGNVVFIVVRGVNIGVYFLKDDRIKLNFKLIYNIIENIFYFKNFNILLGKDKFINLLLRNSNKRIYLS